MELNTLRSLYIEELKDVYSAENQITEALPKMAKAASDEKLKNAFKEHLEQTKGHIERLDEIFNDLHEGKDGETCEAMEGLLSEGEDIIEADGDASVKDAALIAAAQRVEHYEMAAYGTLRTWAELLEYDNHMELLQSTLDEEGETDEKLTGIAKHVNKSAND